MLHIISLQKKKSIIIFILFLECKRMLKRRRNNKHMRLLPVERAFTFHHFFFVFLFFFFIEWGILWRIRRITSTTPVSLKRKTGCIRGIEFYFLNTGLLTPFLWFLKDFFCRKLIFFLKITFPFRQNKKRSFCFWIKNR